MNDNDNDDESGTSKAFVVRTTAEVEAARKANCTKTNGSATNAVGTTVFTQLNKE